MHDQRDRIAQVYSTKKVKVSLPKSTRRNLLTNSPGRQDMIDNLNDGESEPTNLEEETSSGKKLEL